MYRTTVRIVDSGPVEIEEGVTVIIGKNEQGKTNFLKAIRAFNPDERFSPGNLPNHLRPTIEDRPASEIPIVKLWFAIEPQDMNKLSEIAENSDSVSELMCVKNYDNSVIDSGSTRRTRRPWR